MFTSNPTEEGFGGIGIRSIVSGYFNGDTWMDFATLDSTSDLLIFINYTNLGFTGLYNLNNINSPVNGVVGDWDNLNGPDIAVCNYGSNTISILKNNGSGNFTKQVIGDSYVSKPRGICAGDFDGDQDLDFAITNDSSTNVTIFLNNGTGSFNASQVNAGAALSSIVCADLDADGDLDLAGTNWEAGSGNTVRILTNSGSSNFTLVSPFTNGGHAPQHIVSGDFFGDGKIDLAVTNQGTHHISILKNTGGTNSTLNFVLADSINVENDPEFILTGDYDGDGNSDLAVANYLSHSVSIIKKTSVFAFITSTDPSTICTGNSALLQANTGTGLTYQWALNGINIPGATASSYNASIGGSYTVLVTNALSCSAISPAKIIIINPCVTLNLKLFIEGFYSGFNTMTPVLFNQGVSSSVTECDSILIELHRDTAPYETLASTNTVLNVDGTAIANFAIATGSYYIAVKHRNAIQTWSALPVTFGAFPISYDFSTSVIQAYGGNQVQVGSGVSAFFSGDVNKDENIDLLDMPMLETDISGFQFGYFSTDINGDGNVDLLDLPIIETNINNFIFSSHP